MLFPDTFSPELVSQCLFMLTFEEAIQVCDILGISAMRLYNDLLWKQFFGRMGFSFEDCDRTNYLQEIHYRRRLHKCFFKVAPSVVPRNYCFVGPTEDEQLRLPLVHVLPRNQMVGSRDYRRSRRLSRDRSAVFSFELVSNGVGQFLSVVDIDNHLLLTISRHSIGQDCDNKEVMIQESLLDRSDVVIGSVVQRRGLNVIFLKCNHGPRRELLVHYNSNELRRIRLKPEALFVDCVCLEGMPWACIQNQQAECVEFVALTSTTKMQPRASWSADRKIVTEGCVVDAVAASHDCKQLMFVSRKRDATCFLEGFITVTSMITNDQRRIHLKSTVEKVLRHRDPSLLAALMEPPGITPPLSRPTICRTEFLANDSIAVTTHCVHGDRAILNAGMALAFVWDLVTWDLLALINIPVASFPLPKCQLDNNRLVILGQDHFGAIILLYQMIKPDNLKFGVQQTEGSGGLHNFQGERLRFVSRIRPTNAECLNMEKLEMVCNERFIAMRTLRRNLAGPESDGIMIFDGGSKLR